MAETGRPTELNDELFDKLREAILAKKSLKQFANENGIDEATVYNWSYKNYLGFAEKVENWKRDRKLMLAEENIEEMLEMSTEGDPTKLKVKADMSKFVAETLGKKSYAKRSEMTGADGKDLVPDQDVMQKVDSALNDFFASRNIG